MKIIGVRMQRLEWKEEDVKQYKAAEWDDIVAFEGYTWIQWFDLFLRCSGAPIDWILKGHLDGNQGIN